MWVVECCDGLGFPLEPFTRMRISGHVRVKDFDRDRPV